MQQLPSRQALAALVESANAVLRTAAVGFAHRLDDGRLFVLYVSRNGLGAHVLDAGEVPDALQPDSPGLIHVDPALLTASRYLATEWQLGFFGVRCLISVPVEGLETATRFWMGRDDARPPSAAERAGVEALALSSARVLRKAPSAADRRACRRRLDRVGDLLPTLADAPDPGTAFTRLSAAAKAAVPHDLLLLRQFSHDMTTATVFAQSDRGPVAGPPLSHGYPVPVIRAWEYSIVDDLQRHPMEADAPLTKLGARSVLRCAVRSGDRTIGGLAFLSFAPAAYSTIDLCVAQRLAAGIATVLSNHAVAYATFESA